MYRWTWPLGLWALGWVACTKKDNPVPNQPPFARFFLDTIALDSSNRLPSRFTLSWYGEDPDGYVVGYELRTEGGAWAFTAAQESTFVVAFRPGEMYKDWVFEVRAIDNLGARTPVPARLRVPLRNSPPTCTIDPVLLPPDTTLPAITLSLRIEDPDGAETVESLYVRIGSGPWISLSPRYTLLTFVPQNPTLTGSPTLLYAGTTLTPLLTLPTPLALDDTNRLYVRVKDQGGLFSEPDSTRPIFVRRKSSDWLVMDSWQNDDAATTLAADWQAAWGAYDYWNLRLPAQRPPLLIPTWLHIWRLYPRVYWLGGVTRIPDLEAAETLIERYLAGGGRLFINFPLPSTLDPNSPIFRWSPCDSLSSTYMNGLLAPGGAVTNLVAAFPSLANGLPYYMSGINPPYPKGTAVVLYEMPTLQQGNGQPWPSGLPRIAALAFPAATPSKYTQVFCILPLHQLSGDRVGFLTALQNALQP
ncbi:MAG: hypothetical protein N3A68_08690 [Bacteroidia bacterium]|nr:hypothetical protein [Bacteroidia bacterium]GIV24162.1 MAG: hypothetical protein KatS3mg025_1821 [Bacteroidia bacterium]